MELVCPAGTPAALKVAVKAGAHSVYCGFRNKTNARNFPGLNFSVRELKDAVSFANDHGSKVLVAINTYPEAGNQDIWFKAVDDASKCGAHAVIMADCGLLEYAHKNHPNLRRHLSVQATSSTIASTNFYVEQFGVSRVVLPRVMTVDKIKEITANTKAETEVFVFGGLCVMAEGRCSLSSYVTGLSPNKDGVCSPAHHVKYKEEKDHIVSELNDVTINMFNKEESPGYPTICKGRFIADGKPSYLFEEPTSLSVINMLPSLHKAGVSALKIEGRQRSKSYVENIVKAFRKALDELEKGRECDIEELKYMAEGSKSTTGAYKKNWT